MKKAILIILSLLSLLIIYIGYIVLSPTKLQKSIYCIPKNAVYILESQEPIQNWEKIKKNTIWSHLRNNNTFADLTANTEELDKLIQSNKKILNAIQSKATIISSHAYAKGRYEYLFVFDLQKASKIFQFKSLLGSFIGNSYSLTERHYEGKDILELYDKQTKETLYFSMLNNNLVLSFSSHLVEASIRESVSPELGRDIHFLDVNKKVAHTDMFRLYMNYEYWKDYVNSFTSTELPWVNKIADNLKFSGFHFDIKEEDKLFAQGYTNLHHENSSYLQGLQKSGKGKRTISKVAPASTAAYVSFGFKSLKDFYKNMMDVQNLDPDAKKRFYENKEKLENFLNINLEENVIQWVADEIGLLYLQPSGLGKKNDFALVLKAKNKGVAIENLNLILKQIKKKTPVKFKQIDYKGYPINFLSVKGFFDALFGKFFASIEKPYFTVIEEYVVFSNHPNTIKVIINEYAAKKTLYNNPVYQNFEKDFSSKSSLFAYINTPIMYQNILSHMNGVSRANMINNKEYITCFTPIGIQFSPTGNMFETKLVVHYKDKSEISEFSKDFIGPKIIRNDDPEMPSNYELIQQVETSEIISIPEINPEDLDAKKHEEFYDNGQLKLKVSLKDGMRNGTYREYYESGELKYKGRFKKDQRVGTWRTYDTEGNTMEKVRY